MADIDDRKKLIASLFGAANKPCDETRMDGYLEALRRMDTPRLMRVVTHVLDGIEHLPEHEDYKPPTAGGLWKILKKLRALPAPRPLELTPPPAAAIDGWDQNANLLLMQYLWAAHAPKGITRYAPDDRYDEKARRTIPGPQTIERTKIMTKWKSAWATDMREDRAEHGKLDGKKHWVDCMALAEAELDRYIASQQVAA
ncbi:MAG TPA: hypothetical protein VGP93_09825 [Polyangiaceae bacterium]|nr:hypothetical protein [Polyangiaceae bacterium]